MWNLRVIVLVVSLIFVNAENRNHARLQNTHESSRDQKILSGEMKENWKRVTNAEQLHPYLPPEEGNSNSGEEAIPPVHPYIPPEQQSGSPSSSPTDPDLLVASTPEGAESSSSGRYGISSIFMIFTRVFIVVGLGTIIA